MVSLLMWNSTTMTKRLRVIITYEYDADPEHYGTEVPEEMAAVDQYNWDHYYDFCMDMLTEHIDDMDIKVEPVD